MAGQTFAAGAGEFIYLPKGVVHTHSAGGGKPAKALVIQTPSGVERFIAEAGKLAAEPSISPAPPGTADLKGSSRSRRSMASRCRSRVAAISANRPSDARILKTTDLR